MKNAAVGSDWIVLKGDDPLPQILEMIVRVQVNMEYFERFEQIYPHLANSLDSYKPRIQASHQGDLQHLQRSMIVGRDC